MAEKEQAPQRIQLSRAKGWRMPENTLKVDRSTPWGNPFPVAKVTSTTMGVTSETWAVGTWNGPAMWFKPTKHEATQLSVDAFRAWICEPAQSAHLENARQALRGKNLACWCRSGQPCHADVLLEILDGRPSLFTATQGRA